MAEDRPGLIERADELKTPGDAARTAIAKEEAERVLGHLARHGKDHRFEAIAERLRQQSDEMKEAIAAQMRADKRYGQRAETLMEVLPFLEKGEKFGQGTGTGTAEPSEKDKKGPTTKTIQSADRPPLKRKAMANRDQMDIKTRQKVTEKIGTGSPQKETGPAKSPTR